MGKPSRRAYLRQDAAPNLGHRHCLHMAKKKAPPFGSAFGNKNFKSSYE